MPWPRWVLTLSRPPMRSWPLPAGFGNMPPVRCGIYTTLGCIPWTTGLAVAGYYLGSDWQSVANSFHGPTYIIAAIVGVAGLAALVVYFRRRR